MGGRCKGHERQYPSTKLRYNNTTTKGRWCDAASECATCTAEDASHCTKASQAEAPQKVPNGYEHALRPSMVNPAATPTATGRSESTTFNAHPTPRMASSDVHRAGRRKRLMRLFLFDVGDIAEAPSRWRPSAHTRSVCLGRPVGDPTQRAPTSAAVAPRSHPAHYPQCIRAPSAAWLGLAPAGSACHHRGTRNPWADHE